MSHESRRSPQTLVQKQFGKQAKAYATTSGLLADRGNLDTIIEMAEISKQDRVLDVASGTGFLAAALSEVAGQVIITDLTAPMLEEARIKVGDKANAAFALADADQLPFATASMDAVTCRVAFHHFSNPMAALREMKRVCKPNGRIVIMDVISSESKDKSERHQRIERLRDPSHVTNYSRTEFEQMIRISGLEISKLKLWPFTWSFDEWLDVAGPDADSGLKIQELMRESIEGDKSGLQVKLREESLFLTYTSIMLVAHK